MECPKCGGKTTVDATRIADPEDGPQQVLRQRRCLGDPQCRFRFWTCEEWRDPSAPAPLSRRQYDRKRARARARERNAGQGQGQVPPPPRPRF